MSSLILRFLGHVTAERVLLGLKLLPFKELISSLLLPLLEAVTIEFGVGARLFQRANIVVAVANFKGGYH
jgi:hypothetical protein